MDTRDIYRRVRELDNDDDAVINLHDSFDLELNESFIIETGVVGFTEDGVILHLDEDAMEFLDFHGILLEDDELQSRSRHPDDEVVRIMKRHGRPVGEIGIDHSYDYDYPVWYAYHYASEHDSSGHDSKAEAWSELKAAENIHTGKAIYLEEDEDSYEAVKSAISHRIRLQHPDLLSKYGLDKVLDAIEQVASFAGSSKLDEIGSSDISIWVNYVIDDLKSMYPDWVPDSEDDVDPNWNPNLDEVARIKNLALGNTDLEEGWKGKVLGGAALLAAILGGNKLHYDHMLKTDPQLSALVRHLETAQARGDEYKVRDIKDRIKQTYAHIQATGSPVMGPDGEPVEPKYESMNEAEYQGRKVPLNKPMQGDVKKSKVYVKKPNGKVVKVNFGDKNMRIKKSNPGRRKNFRARHNCDNPGPKWKARYWSCKAW